MPLQVHMKTAPSRQSLKKESHVPQSFLKQRNCYHCSYLTIQGPGEHRAKTRALRQSIGMERNGLLSWALGGHKARPYIFGRTIDLPYFFRNFLLPSPARPTRPVPNSSMVAGSGTGALIFS